MTLFARQAPYVALAVAIAVAVWCASASTPAVADVKPLDTLGRLVGTWKSTGTFVKSDYSSTGSAHATTVCEWSRSREFVICQQAVVFNGALSHDIAIYSYDPVAKRYNFHNIGLSNASDSTIDVTKKTITYPSSFKDHGHTVTMRTVNIWDSQELYDFRTEFSVDGGKHWTMMLSGSSHRVASE
jgi:hypothetical protein